MPFAVAKPSTWTLNTGHAKAPTHLWMLDEGSTTTASDSGTGTARNMTLQNAAMWGSDALGDYITVNSTSSYYAKTATGSVWNGSGGLLLISIFKTDAAVGPLSTEYWLGTFNSAGTAEVSILNTTTNEQAQAKGIANDASSVSRNSTADVYDQAWHMVAAKFKAGSATECCAISIDGGAFALDAADTLGSPITLDRYAIGARARATINGIANGKTLAAWVYESGTYATWNDAWIANLYADPWQFLTTAPTLTTKVKLTAPAAAASASSIEGVVLNAARDTVIGEFTGQTFEAALEGGEAVLKINVADITPDGSTLTTSDTPLVVAYNTTHSTDLATATVIEE